ncbi:hypothetical protein FNH08_26670 [Streptomyces spongiae]|uniref:DUF418 domain-containing protein n=1 Tax=Streptomyces spongiae TaxID=565072 RepID=A0A5N8XMD8_9ACTN|nr:hypothetical protein [Streptomyces spongiae]
MPAGGAGARGEWRGDRTSARHRRGRRGRGTRTRGEAERRRAEQRGNRPWRWSATGSPPHVLLGFIVAVTVLATLWSRFFRRGSLEWLLGKATKPAGLVR